MSYFRRMLLLKLLKFLDIFVFISSLLVASIYITAPDESMNLVEFLSMRISIGNFAGILLMIIIWHMIFKYFRLYSSRRLETDLSIIKDILSATTLSLVIFMLAGFIFNISVFTLHFLVVFWLTSTCCTLLFRGIIRYSLKKVRSYGMNLRYILIVGSNRRAYKFERMIESKKDLGYRIMGFIDDKRKYKGREDVKLIGDLEDFPDIIRDNIVDEVIITLPVKSYYEQIQAIIKKAEEQGISVRVVADIFNTKYARLRVGKFENCNMITISLQPYENWQYVAKRIVDIVFSTVFIILSIPFLALIAIAIKLTSKGSILFIQNRVGFNKRVFHLYKFRTMFAGAEQLQSNYDNLNEMDGPVFKIKDDPRTTTIGKWLRKLSLDELPQFFNVIKGDMSLVGPRPLPMRDYNGFSKDWQRRRFSILPGITCTWQVNGRNIISFEDWMKMDMEYIDNWKFSNDLAILLRTIPAVFKRKGAA